jgi:hypothetical protein
MALLTCNGLSVLEATIRMPKIGAWDADVVIDTADASQFLAGQRVTLTTDDGEFSLVGTVRLSRTGVWIDSTRCRVVGGAGGLSQMVPARYYQYGTLKIPLGDILSAAGESLSSTADAGVLATSLQSWTTVAQRAGMEIAALAQAAGPAVSWRVLSDGTIWLGPESWPAAPDSFEYTLIDQHPNENRAEIGADTLALVPGMSLGGQNISHLVHTVEPERVRTSVFYE